MNIIMKWLKRLRKNQKGFSLVELICTVAIFSIIITGVGSAMVISARSYHNGNVELDLQQQAQITANLLTNLIIDANLIEEPSSDIGGTILRIKKEETVSGTPVSVSYEVTYDSSEKRLLYSREGGASQILAENITGFSIRRVAANNYDFSLKVTEGNRNYESDYHVTPRNGASEETNTALTGEKGLYVENKLILEPGQGMVPGEEYDLAVRITGTSIQDYTIANLSGNVSSDTAVTKVDSRMARIRVGLDETGTGVGDNAGFSFDVVPSDSSIAPINVKVLVRRVNSVNVNGYKTSGKVNKAGATYKVTASLLGTNLEKEPGVWYDVDYVNPYTTTWSYEFTKTDDNGNPVILPFESMFQIVGQGVEGNIPYVIIKLTGDMTRGCKLKVIGTALHPEGEYPVGSGNETNKSGMKYGEVQGVWVLEYQGWRRNGTVDIGIHELIADRDFWIGEDGKPHHKYEASVTYTGYNKYGMILNYGGTSTTMNPWTPGTNDLLNAKIDGNNIKENWGLTMNPSRDSGSDPGRAELEKRMNAYKSYSTPYFTAEIKDNYGIVGAEYDWSDNNPAGFGWAPARYAYVAGAFLDPTRYEISVSYQYTDENGNLLTNVISDEYDVEDVSILYKNAVAADWKRINKIYVTTADQITDYNVYFQFDAGWEETQYYFHDLARFVGVIHDDEDDTKDQRRDIVVTQDPILETSGHPGTVESTYITFHLSAADKEECKRLSEAYGGVVKEIFEYNPFLDMLNRGEAGGTIEPGGMVQEEDGTWVWKDPVYGLVYPSFGGYGTITHDMMNDMKGCEGIVEFHFVEPNITGTTLKAMYCPTLTEYGAVYYIDNNSRFNIQAATAQYQELVGGTWSTVVNLTWNGSGWTAN